MILFPVQDKETGEDATIGVRNDPYKIVVQKEEYADGWLEIRVSGGCLRVTVYHPGKDIPEVFQIGNTKEQDAIF